MIDRFSMANSIEFRNPYLYYDFARYCMGIKNKYYFKDNLGKMPMRKLMNNFDNKLEWFQKK